MYEADQRNETGSIAQNAPAIFKIEFQQDIAIKFMHGLPGMLGGQLIDDSGAFENHRCRVNYPGKDEQGFENHKKSVKKIPPFSNGTSFWP